MKVLMVTRENRPDKHFGSDKRYGLNKSLAPIIDELTARGIEVSYLSQTEAGVEGITKLRSIHRFLVKIFARFFKHTDFVAILWGLMERLNMGRLAVKVMAKGNYTHVHCHDPFIAAGYRWFARVRWYACLRQCHTARWGVTEHGFGCFSQAFHEDGALLGSKVMAWLKRWESKVLLKAHWVITPTKSGLRQLARDLSIHPIPSSWHYVYHPIPKLNLYTKDEAREKLKWSKTDAYIISVGRLAKLKQFPLLVKACSYLQQPNWRLVIIGEGDRTELLHLAKELKIQDRLDFAITDDMGLYYSAADIYVSTSITESFGLANFEALAMGIPSVCTAVGGVPEVVGSGAWQIPAENTSALVHAMRDLLSNNASRYFWSMQAQTWIAGYPKTIEIADVMLGIYQGHEPKGLLHSLGYQQLAFPAWQDQINSLQKCPLPQELQLPHEIKVLVVAPHFDDETLGCGGTLARLQKQGCATKVVIMTDGSSKGEPLADSNMDVSGLRKEETNCALDLLEIGDRVFLNGADGYFKETAEVHQQMTKILDDYSPDWIFIPPILDNHRDHIAISLTMLNLWQRRNNKERLFCYETWTPLPATHVVNISDVFELKQQAIGCYKIPLQYCDYSNAFNGLAKYRGLCIKPPGQYAEAFMEIKKDSSLSVIQNLFAIRRSLENFLN